MRIIAGRFKGRRLHAPAKGSRTTTDRVRESLFAVLGDLEGMRVVDLFSGAGTLGMEALSRGAVEAHFVEKGRAALVSLERNAEPAREAGLTLVVHPMAVRRFINTHWPAGRIDLVFMDPPYDDPEGEACLALLAERHGENIGRVVFEPPGREEAKLPEGLVFERELLYGDTRLTLMKGREGP